MRRSRRRLRPIDIVSPTEFRAILDHISHRSKIGIRNRAALATMFFSGLRVGELIALRPRDVDLGALGVTVQSGKNGQRRIAPLISDAADIVHRWIDVRRELGVGANHPLFCTVSRGVGPVGVTPGAALSREYLNRALRRAASRAGVEKRVTPHTLRHSFAVLLDRRGVSVNSIRAALGHARLDTTQIYVSHLANHDVCEQVRALGPMLDPKPARAELGELLARLDERDVAQLVALLKKAAE
jgi:integrase